MFSNSKSKIKGLKKIQKILYDYGNPYGLTVKKYFVIKYILSTFVFVLSFLRNKNLIASLICFIIIFFIPNILLAIFKKSEKIKIFTDITVIVEILLLSLTARLTLFESFKTCVENLKYKRFKEEFIKFINDYEMYNFNVKKAANEIIDKFDSYEFNMLMSVIIQSEKDGNLVQNLQVYNNTLDLAYFKKLKYDASKRLMYVTIATVVSIINILFLVLYPMLVEITSNLEVIFG